MPDDVHELDQLYRILRFYGITNPYRFLLTEFWTPDRAEALEQLSVDLEVPAT